MTVKELRDKLGELMVNGYGEMPVVAITHEQNYETIDSMHIDACRYRDFMKGVTFDGTALILE